MADRRREVVWSPQARSALDEILEYIAKDSVQGAQTILTKVAEVTASLATFSERGRVVPEVESPDVREVFVGTYRILYEVHPEEIVVLAVLHGARDFFRWLEEN